MPAWAESRPGRTFGRVAEAYSRTRPPYPRAAVEFGASALGVTPDATVLDLGAGTGTLTRVLRDVFAHVVAVEPDERMRARFHGDVVAGTAEAIPLPDDAVEAVFVGEAFHWFDAEPALSEIRRVGRGLAILTRSWGETEQRGLLPPSFWAELEVVWDRFHGTRGEFPSWHDVIEPDGSEQFVEIIAIGGRDLVDLHLTASTPASIDDDERAAIAARAYPLMAPTYDLRVVTEVYWKRLRR